MISDSFGDVLTCSLMYIQHRIELRIPNKYVFIEKLRRFDETNKLVSRQQRLDLVLESRLLDRYGLGPSPGWGPYGPDFASKIINFHENHEIVNKNMKGVKSEKIKVTTWFGDKDLSS